ncbi:MAG: lytic transglycosylase domain-containing protein [Deltaproteobacteria bacterium]|nr:lytic transglycosylase domain-containing protein [Deltaproteobacteria bacterium]
MLVFLARPDRGFVVVILIILMSLSIPLLSSDCLGQEAKKPYPAVSLDIPEEMVFAGTVIPLNRYDMRERYDREQMAFTYAHASTLVTIKRANLYFPIIEAILKENGIPEDFKYLALVESNFNTRAFSSAKAAGIWQFMPETGRQYGLEISSDVDERYHIEKSTMAACRYLKDAYDRFGDWATAAASYNAGMGRISTEQSVQQVGSFFDMLVFSETSRYVFRILAIKEILKNPRKYGFYIKREHLYPSIGYSEVTVNGPVENWAEFAKAFGITYAQLKDFNVWIRGNKLENKDWKSYVVRIPCKEDLMFDVKKIKVYQKNWVVD